MILARRRCLRFLGMPNLPPMIPGALRYPRANNLAPRRGDKPASEETRRLMISSRPWFVRFLGARRPPATTPLALNFDARLAARGAPGAGSWKLKVEKSCSMNAGAGIVDARRTSTHRGHVGMIA